MGSTGADRRVRRRPLLTVLACGLLAASVVLGFAAFAGRGSAQSSPSPASAAPSSVATTSVAPAEVVAGPAPARRSAPGVPLRLRVPRLGLDTTISPITPAGTVLTPPADPKEVGWWREGAEPGAGHGRVLITGHTVHTGGGAFDHLDRLEPGDRVEVATAHHRRDYHVTRVLFLTPGQLAARSPRLFRQSGPEQLVLVTCAAWDGTAYDGSTVVLAKPDAGSS